MRFTRSRTGFLAGAGVLAVLAASGPGFAGVSLAARDAGREQAGMARRRNFAGQGKRPHRRDRAERRQCLGGGGNRPDQGVSVR